MHCFAFLAAAGRSPRFGPPSWAHSSQKFRVFHQFRCENMGRVEFMYDTFFLRSIRLQMQNGTFRFWLGKRVSLRWKVARVVLGRHSLPKTYCIIAYNWDYLMRGAGKQHKIMETSCVEKNHNIAKGEPKTPNPLTASRSADSCVPFWVAPGHVSPPEFATHRHKSLAHDSSCRRKKMEASPSRRRESGMHTNFEIFFFTFTHRFAKRSPKTRRRALEFTA